MKTILMALLALWICGAALAQGEKSDPVGTWKCDYTIGDNKRTSTLTIKKDGDKLAGTMLWADQPEAKLKDLKLTDGVLTFSAVREVTDNEFNIEYKLKLDADKFKGTGALELGGEKRSFEIEGTRQKKDK